MNEIGRSLLPMSKVTVSWRPRSQASDGWMMKTTPVRSASPTSASEFQPIACRVPPGEEGRSTWLPNVIVGVSQLEPPSVLYSTRVSEQGSPVESKRS